MVGFTRAKRAVTGVYIISQSVGCMEPCGGVRAAGDVGVGRSFRACSVSKLCVYCSRVTAGPVPFADRAWHQLWWVGSEKVTWRIIAQIPISWYKKTFYSQNWGGRIKGIFKNNFRLWPLEADLHQAFLHKYLLVNCKMKRLRYSSQYQAPEGFPQGMEDGPQNFLVFFFLWNHLWEYHDGLPSFKCVPRNPGWSDGI